MSVLNELNIQLKEAVKDKFKAAFQSDEIYNVIDSCELISGSTPCAGACAIIAFALNKMFKYPIYVIYNVEQERVDHFVVKTDRGTYIDCDGETKDIVKAFKKREHVDSEIKLLPYTKDMEIRIYWDFSYWSHHSIL